MFLFKALSLKIFPVQIKITVNVSVDTICKDDGKRERENQRIEIVVENFKKCF